MRLIALVLLAACGTPTPDPDAPSPGTQPGEHARHAAAGEAQAGDHATHGGDHGSHGDHAYKPDGHGEHAHQHRFDDPEKWAERFDDPTRDAWQKPEAVIALLGLDKDDVVADIGAGTGYFVMRLAPEVPEGKVLGVDLEPTMVDYLVKRARDGGLENVEGVVAKADDPALTEPVDLALIVDTYHHISDRPAWLGKLKASLKPGGKVAVVDFKMGDIPVGPPESGRLAPEVVGAELAAAGFRRITRDEGTLPHQYVLVYGLEP